MSAKSAWLRVPQHLRPGLARYLVHGLHAGGFLKEALSNNLTGAVMQGDATSVAGLRDLVIFLYNYAPNAAYGCDSSYAHWVAQSQAERLRLVRINVEDAFEQMVADSGIPFGVPVEEVA